MSIDAGISKPQSRIPCLLQMSSMVASSMALHYMADFTEAIKRVLKGLKPTGGLFIRSNITYARRIQSAG